VLTETGDRDDANEIEMKLMKLILETDWRIARTAVDRAHIPEKKKENALTITKAIYTIG